MPLAMNHDRDRHRLASLAGAALLVVTGCASDVVTVAQRPPEHYERVGHTSGEACGVLLFYSTIYSIFPVMLTSRLQRAYTDALSHAPGATGLVNTEISEFYFWWIIGTTYCTMLDGDGIREVSAPAPPPEVESPPPAPPAPPTGETP